LNWQNLLHLVHFLLNLFVTSLDSISHHLVNSVELSELNLLVLGGSAKQLSVHFDLGNGVLNRFLILEPVLHGLLNDEFQVAWQARLRCHLNLDIGGNEILELQVLELRVEHDELLHQHQGVLVLISWVILTGETPAVALHQE